MCGSLAANAKFALKQLLQSISVRKRIVLALPILAICSLAALCAQTGYSLFPQLAIYPDMVVVEQFMSPVASRQCEVVVTQRHMMATQSDWQTVSSRLPRGWTYHPDGWRHPGLFSASRQTDLRFFGTLHSFVEYKQSVTPAKVFLMNTLTLQLPGCDLFTAFPRP